MSLLDYSVPTCHYWNVNREAMSERSGRLKPTMAVTGGIAFVLATVQYAVAQIVAASAWNPPYDWMKNFISDPGNTACGPFSVHGPATYVCSPLHAVMNGSFIAT